MQDIDSYQWQDATRDKQMAKKQAMGDDSLISSVGRAICGLSALSRFKHVSRLL